MGEDYEAIQKRLCKNPVLRRAVNFAPGIRVLKQPFFETLITFIISQNNNIPRIRKITEQLCTLFGEKRGEGENAFYTFPTAEALCQLTKAELAPLRAGWRDAYILDAARLAALGCVSEEAVAALPTQQARALLMTVHGVGPKVADCVLLFACGRLEVCPMDVWMKRAMAQLLPNGFPRSLQPIAGLAQQYLFHYARHCLPH